MPSVGSIVIVCNVTFFSTRTWTVVHELQEICSCIYLIGLFRAHGVGLGGSCHQISDRFRRPAAEQTVVFSVS